MAAISNGDDFRLDLDGGLTMCCWLLDKHMHASSLSNSSDARWPLCNFRRIWMKCHIIWLLLLSKDPNHEKKISCLSKAQPYVTFLAIYFNKQVMFILFDCMCVHRCPLSNVD